MMPWIADLKKKAVNADEWLKHLYKLVEDGFVEMNEPSRQRIGELPRERDLAHGASDRARDLASVRSISGNKIAAFSKRMREKLSTGDVIFRKNHLRAILGAVDVHATQGANFRQ